MLNTIVKFAACLRAYDLKVSTSEVLDCARSLRIVRPSGEADFKTVVRAHFLKTRRDQDRFDKVYHLFFYGGFPGGEPAETADPLASADAGITDDLNRALAGETGETPMEKALLEFLAGDPQAFLAAMHALHTRPEKRPAAFKSNLSQLSAKLDVMLTIDRMRKTIGDFPAGRPDTDDIGRVQAVTRQYQALLDRARDLLAREAVTGNDGLTERKRPGDSRNSLGDKPFSGLTGPELDQTRALMERLVRKMRDKAGRRYRARSTGSIDIKKTLRRAGRYQGVPIDIIFKKRPPQKGRIVALCDVSGSVWSTARFMLQMLYSLADCFNGVRSFVFVSGLAEVTGYFNTPDITAAVTRALTDAPVNLSDRTDYGAVFQSFRAGHLDILTPKTTLIILGDGRSNYYNPQAHLLAEIRERCRRIIWLTPEPGHTWNLGDSEIHTYKAHCHEVRTCMNLRHLSSFVEELVL